MKREQLGNVPGDDSVYDGWREHPKPHRLCYAGFVLADGLRQFSNVHELSLQCISIRHIESVQNNAVRLYAVRSG